MIANEAYKYFGLYSICLFVGVTILLTTLWHEDNALTLSKHIAKHKAAYFIFALTSVVGQTLFTLYMLGWFIPTFQLGAVLAAILILGTVCQLTAAWVPDTTGLAHRVHHFAAYTMALTMYVFTLWIGLSPTISTVGRLFGIGSFLAITYLYWGFFFKKQSRQKMFIYQNIYLLLFCATVLISGYSQ